MNEPNAEQLSATPSNEREQLDAGLAFRLAAQLQAVPGFPRREEAIEAISDWLIDHCTGAEHQRQHWDPERQARWLVRTAIEWEGWRGAAGLRELLVQRFYPTLTEYQGLGPKPRITCRCCNDWGIIVNPGGLAHVEWCNCPAGEALRAEQPDLLKCHNRPPTFHPVTQTEIDEALAAYQAAKTKAEQSPGPKGTGDEQKEKTHAE
jgi:hypothetical protein